MGNADRGRRLAPPGFAAAAILLCAFLAPAGPGLHAQSRSNILDPAADPRGRPELVVCSQNLAEYGIYRPGGEDDEEAQAAYQRKEEALTRRFTGQGCDVIALQEILAKDQEAGTNVLEHLAAVLRRASNRFYDVKSGLSNDSRHRNGFLVARDRAEILDSLSYARVELPKLAKEQKPREFARGPLELQIRVKPFGDSPSKTVTLVTFHFKSKRGSGGDPAEQEWETWRMEMAEALRRVVESRHAQSFASGETLLILIGDRNSNFDTASARILEGVLTLGNFQGEAPCRLSKRGVPLCQAGTSRPQKLFSVLTGDPETHLAPGTFKYKKIYSWLDDILMPAESLRFAWKNFDSSGDYDSGVISDPPAASDHAMVYVKLNW